MAEAGRQKASRICHTQPFDGFDDENWPAMIEWLCRHIVTLEEAFSEPLAGLNRQLKSQSETSVGGPGDAQ